MVNLERIVIPGGKSPNGDNYVPLILQLLLKTSGKISSGDLNEMYWYQIPTTPILEIIYKFSDTCLWRKSVKCLWPLSVPVSLLNCPLEHHHGHFEDDLDDWWGWQDITDDKEANSQRIHHKRLTLQTIMMFFLNSSTSGLLFIISSSSCTGKPLSDKTHFRPGYFKAT